MGIKKRFFDYHCPCIKNLQSIDDAIHINFVNKLTDYKSIDALMRDIEVFIRSTYPVISTRVVDITSTSKIKHLQHLIEALVVFQDVTYYSQITFINKINERKRKSK